MKLILISLLSFNCMAQNVATVKKGEPVPFDGVLFSKDKELEIRKEVLEKDFLEKKVNLLEELGRTQEKELEIANKRTILYREQSKEFADREVTSENTSFLKGILYFTAGALLTGALSYGVIQSNR